MIARIEQLGIPWSHIEIGVTIPLSKRACRNLFQWDPWGVPEGYECEVIENDAPIPKHVPQHRPPPLPEEFYKTLEAVASSKNKDELSSTSSSQLKE
ncbi:hypothetical protein ACLOJK_041390 [Asimina triloba]